MSKIKQLKSKNEDTMNLLQDWIAISIYSFLDDMLEDI